MPSTSRQIGALLMASAVAPYVTTFVYFLSVARGEGVQWLMIPFVLVFAIWGVFLGFVGAATFLLPAFLAASLFRATRWTYPIAGLCAGLAHTLLGWLTVTPWGSVPAEIDMFGGFMLVEAAASQPWNLVSLAIAAGLGGLASGWIFAWVLGLGRLPPWPAEDGD